jgi:hypothetical protein
MSEQQLTFLLKILDIFAAGIQLTPELLESYNASKAKIQQFVQEGRDPTAEEWEELNNKIDSLQNELTS